MDQLHQNFVQSISINFHHQGALDQKLEVVYQDLWVKAISCNTFIYVGPIKKLVYLTTYLWVNNKTISCSIFFKMLDPLISLST
jgi:hypothetical protein